MERSERWLSLAIFFSFYEKVSGADLTHVSQICPCLELSISRQPDFAFSGLFRKSGKIFGKNCKKMLTIASGSDNINELSQRQQGLEKNKIKKFLTKQISYDKLDELSNDREP